MIYYYCILVASSAVAIANSFSWGTGPIHLANVQCTGSESSLTDCRNSNYNNCFHHEDAAVSCMGGKCCATFVLLKLVSILSQAQWLRLASTHCSCTQIYILTPYLNSKETIRCFVLTLVKSVNEDLGIEPKCLIMTLSNYFSGINIVLPLKSFYKMPYIHDIYMT